MSVSIRICPSVYRISWSLADDTPGRHYLQDETEALFGG